MVTAYRISIWLLLCMRHVSIAIYVDTYVLTCKSKFIRSLKNLSFLRGWLWTKLAHGRIARVQGSMLPELDPVSIFAAYSMYFHQSKICIASLDSIMLTATLA